MIMIDTIYYNKIYCLVQGDSRLFPVTTNSDGDVADLKKLIQEQRQHGILHNINAKDLVLWKLLEPEPLKPNDTLAQRIQSRGTEISQFAQRLDIHDNLLDVFPEQVTKNHLHILVQLPSAVTINPVPTIAAAPKFQIVAESSTLHELWKHCWESDTNGSSMFRLHQIQRDLEHPASKDIHVPPHCWVLNIQPWIRDLIGLDSDIPGFMIREEYTLALRAAIQFYKGDEQTFRTTTVADEGNDNDAMEIDTGDLLQNPFTELPSSLVSTRGGFIVVGHPGIGTTAWLHVVLIWRLQAGLPTIYQSHPSFLLFFNAEGAFTWHHDWPLNALELWRDIPSSTWCLIDSNINLTKVPAFITSLCCFIVQAWSPQNEHFTWRDKAGAPVMTYYMKPWSLTEILSGRMIQRTHCSEAELEQFYIKFGPSARSAYAYANMSDTYETALLERIRLITYKDLDCLVRSSRWLDLSDQLSHKLLLISPSQMRSGFEASIATTYLYELLRDALSTRHLESANRLYLLFICNSLTRGSAGYMLDDAIHLLYSQGGFWALVHMEPNPPGPKYTHWKNPPYNAKNVYLRLGYDGQLITITDNSPSAGAVAEALPFYQYKSGENLTLKDGYFCPRHHTQATFDAFIYEEASKMATLIQSTTRKDTPHSVKEEGFRWLQGLGVKSFRYIAVAPPDLVLDLPFPNDLDVPDKYLLVMHSILPA